MQYSWVLLFLAPLIFFVSLLLPGIVYQEGIHSGMDVLTRGWLGPFTAMFAWYANIFALAAYGAALTQSYRTGALMASIAFVVALQSFFFNEYPLDEGGVNIWHVHHLGVGFYVWLLSIVAVLVYCLIGRSFYAKTGRLLTTNRVILYTVLALTVIVGGATFFPQYFGMNTRSQGDSSMTQSSPSALPTKEDLDRALKSFDTQKTGQ